MNTEIDSSTDPGNEHRVANSAESASGSRGKAVLKAAVLFFFVVTD